MRLDQFISTNSPLSRKEARRAIHARRVEVNGEVWKDTGKHVPADAAISLDGAQLTIQGERYLMLNKPAGVVSATRDSDHPTALDLLPAELTQDLHIAGRLDADTTGLLLLTTDGKWSHRVTSPKVDCPKTYRVTLNTPISESAIEELEKGLVLHNEVKPTKPAQVKVVEPQLIELTISEGRYHQVKRMLAAVGNHVEALHRQSIGAVSLDPALKPGAYRELTEQEIASIA
ncbi:MULTISPECIES: 16S rRNA pseudouridine(516) synthase RsuA [unclassified Marinobacter]|uniref:16S rRNA pseudouridine(516) synthase RsuA n=1 Tax=unclassified Marinobacter TaxID=83889 RepID=UPI0019079C70|nr:16S rRNA pseudouridine(516) synthase RsuA [Marinobacter sp. 1-4A]MBK1850854.1 16S rRNA pseudouridine(516) synthase RsuA [Marinobacter sp. 1-4A]